MQPLPQSTLVRSSSVYRSSLKRGVPLYARLDVTPMVILFTIVLYYINDAWQNNYIWADIIDNTDTIVSNTGNISGDAIQDVASSGVGAVGIFDILSRQGIILFILTIFIVFLQIIVQLVCMWSISARCFFRYSTMNVDDVRACTIIIVKANATSPWEMCQLSKLPQCGLFGFRFQRRRYVWHDNSGEFVELDFPTMQACSSYFKSEGLSHDDDQMFMRRCKYGLNQLDVPLPSFGTLFREHATAPFFVFQMLCVAMWLLDEFWYYSLMTLVMLVFLEMTVVNQRLKSLRQVRGMRPPPYSVLVFRSRRWRSVLTSELLPGDLMSIRRSQSSAHTTPCDLLLLSGACVVDESLLTGESVPQLKEPLSSDLDYQPLSMEGVNKCSIIYGGTEVIVHSSESKLSDKKMIKKISRPSDKGCLAYVLRTGFHTAQGRLVSTILCSTERVSVNNAESFVFIFILLMFAMVASGYVLFHSWSDPTRPRSKLIINCIMILTSVVPPELPMELSLAVNTSLARLMRRRIFCTEPFRIPFAGAVDTCCFDKTGTLTADMFTFEGVAACISPNTTTNNNDDNASTVTTQTDSDKTCHTLVQCDDASIDVRRIIGTCHSLVMLEGKLIGDPLERAALNALGNNWKTAGGEAGVIAVKDERGQVLRIQRRFPFASVLKRMTCLVTCGKDGSVMVVSKGAPEMISTLLSVVPVNYERTHRYFSRAGYRVLALAFAFRPDIQESPSLMQSLSRDKLEQGLTFAGFMVLRAPVKKASLSTVVSLKASSHSVIMITGDHALTACAVANEVNITSSDHPTLILSAVVATKSTTDNDNNEMKSDADKQLCWIPVNDDDGAISVPFVNDVTYDPPSNVNDICITGPALALLPDDAFTRLVLKAKVFARVSPEQKQAVIARMKSCGRVTLMCGDGTNDVGALKQAHIGVALLASVNEHSSDKPSRAVKKKKSAIEAAQAAEYDDAAVVELGDASAAAPFTSKRTEVNSCLDIVRQGRCTLVTTMQMYQILALQCLISAYSLSVLYLDGVKLSDTQMTFTGLLVAAMFFFISRAEPLNTLSAERPENSVFTLRMFLSLSVQFAMHLTTLMLAVTWAKPHAPLDEKSRDPDGDFSPNVLNTVVYLVSLSTTIATFAANYKGYPFMESLTDNKALYRSLLFSIALCLSCALELFPDFNKFLELEPLPSVHFRYQLAGLIAADAVGSTLYETILNTIFLKSTRRDID